MLHPLIRWLAARGIRWFYRSADFVGTEKIPDTGPVLLVASHGNDLTDILLAFMVTKRDVLFVANVSAADLPIVKWTFAGLGVIPVARTRDARAMLARGEDVAALNERAFTSVTAALQAGHAVAIFPEGVVHDFPHLAPLRTGAAKMALDAVANGVQNLVLVPVGFQYESPWHPRSGVIGVVGDAVGVNDWRATHAERAVPEFTRFVRQQMQRVTRNSATWSDAQQLSQIVAAGAAVLSSANLSPAQASQQIQQRVTDARGAGAWFVATASGAATQQFEQAALALITLAANFGSERWSAADCASALRSAGDLSICETPPSVLWTVIGAPIAALGAFWHILPVWACYSFAKRSAPTPMEIAGRSIVPGLYLIALWYVSIPVLLLSAGTWPWLVLVLFIVQPRLGDFALQWRDRYRTLRLARRVRTAAPRDKSALVQAAENVRQSWRDALLISIP